jgi:carboxymethylenebutenolidase
MFKRRAFMGLAAGAAAGATLTQALGQSNRVAEDDPAIRTATIRIDLPDVGLPAYSALPRDANANTPGVVVVMHVWGVDASIREVVRGFAKAGFAAIAPDLYARFGAPSGDGEKDYTKFTPFAQKLQSAQVDGDLRAAGLWLRTAHPQGNVGVTGFCMGGAIALRQAVENGDVFAADAVWYGKVAGTDPAKVRIPLLGSYGQRDTSIPADDVRTFFKALRVPNDLAIYPTAAHAFFDHTRPSYVEEAASDGWRRTMVFFTKYLKPQRE